MPKIRHTDTKGLVQETGSGVTLEQGQLTRTVRALTNTVETAAHPATTTATDITLPSCRVLGYKLEVLSVTGAPAGNITDLGTGADDDLISGTIALDMGSVGSLAAPAAATARDVDVSGALSLTHAAAGAANRSCSVRVTVLIEEFA